MDYTIKRSGQRTGSSCRAAASALLACSAAVKEGIGRIAIGPQGIGVRRYTRLTPLDLSWRRIILY